MNVPFPAPNRTVTSEPSASPQRDRQVLSSVRVEVADHHRELQLLGEVDVCRTRERAVGRLASRTLTSLVALIPDGQVVVAVPVEVGDR